MRRLLGAILLLAAYLSPVHAQNLVVTTCGTIPQAFAAGSARYGTIDVNGNNCTSAPAGATGSGNAGYPAGATPISASSGNVAAAAANANLVGVAGKFTYICGFAITSSGSTSAAVVSPSVNNVGPGLTFTYTTVAGVTLANAPLIVNFTPCLPAFAQNQTINVNLPSLGTGNTNASLSAWGYQQ